jgi:hypothetical protein
MKNSKGSNVNSEAIKMSNVKQKFCIKNSDIELSKLGSSNMKKENIIASDLIFESIILNY